MATLSEEAPKRARRGRPKKNMQSETLAAEASGSNAFIPASSSSVHAAQAGPSITLNEFDLAVEALPKKNFCEKNRNRYPVDPLYPYTVGPTEFVVAFFREFVFKRTYKKSVSMESDVRTQIGLQTEENEDSRLTLLQMAENAPSSKNGKKKILEVPIGIEAVNQYKKVLMYLHDFQSERRKVEWPSPKKTKEIVELIIKKYEHDLVYDQVQTNADRAAHCVIRDSYKSGEFIRILKSLWSSESETGLREMFSISSRHHMGIQQAVALVFSLDKGKTLKKERKTDGINWKVLRGRGNPEKSLSGTSQWKTAKKALLDQTIHTTRVTHGGRHTGAMEAEASDIPLDLIKRGGGWKDRLGCLETHYLGKLPSQFARGIAGFWDKPFALARNGVSPPIELQKSIFPWIEGYFGENNAEWITACEREMQEVDENEDEDDNIINLEVDEDPVEFVEEDGRMIVKEKQKKGKQRAVQSSMDTAKRGFLRLLIRCRRIILQDAAVYIPSVGRLEEYEGLVPDLVDTHKQVASRVAEVNRRLLRLQKQQDDRFEKSENSFNNFVEQNNHSNLALINMSQQLARNVQLVMMQQQCLNSQILPQASTFPAAVPTPFPPFSFPPPPSFSFPPPPPSIHHPVAIHSAPPEKITNGNSNGSSKSRQKKRPNGLATSQAAPISFYKYYLHLQLYTNYL
ncbi:hypothetical protein INT46_009226 [Mucor plumbeus]|uniref:Ndc10 domain-containing protein n=1 Tax=Mucor plumbeus TaxID=97098 RepID=A0A8H7RHZ2_9FUNG|nr:hypothetical protein INT46_009226 [Mucor plumbeus]